SLAFDPTDPEVIYAGTRHLAWKTVNGGASWIPVHNGMIDDSDVMTLTPDSRDPQTIYATACTGIYRSTEGGAEWTKLKGIPFSARRTRAFRQIGEDPNLLLAGTTQGLWISEDNGATWSRTTSKRLVINAVIALPGGTILLSTEGAGVLRSVDRGRTWVSSNTGFSERFVYRLMFDTADDRLIVVVRGAPGYGGVFVSQGSAGRWVRLGDGLDGREVLSLALQGNTILAGTDNGMFQRAPDAKAWTRVTTTLDGKELQSRVSDLLALEAGRLVAATGTGLLHSSDGGESWIRPVAGSEEEIFALAASPSNQSLVVAATKSGFLRSLDGGKSWRRASLALNVTPHALAFVPSSSRTLFATTTGGLFRSSDLGTTWRRVNGGLPHSDLTGIAMSPDGRTIYVSDFTWGGVFRSVDGGSTWDRMPTNGLGSDRVWTLAVDPAFPERVLAASRAGGLHAWAPASTTAQSSAWQKTSTEMEEMRDESGRSF
ncbi:MAG TPA: YCF48-related protein, partial [Candidatus Eisenbacteria bacterium]|nr:YCF48-related protein [Candidatus Eisenbacteria bacterium]